MTRTEILEELKEIVLDYLGEDDVEVTESSLLTDDLDLTSLDMISIVGDIEEVFGIEFEDEAMDNISTVSDVIDHIESRL